MSEIEVTNRFYYVVKDGHVPHRWHWSRLLYVDKGGHVTHVDDLEIVFVLLWKLVKSSVWVIFKQSLLCSESWSHPTSGWPSSSLCYVVKAGHSQHLGDLQAVFVMLWKLVTAHIWVTFKLSLLCWQRWSCPTSVWPSSSLCYVGKGGHIQHLDDLQVVFVMLWKLVMSDIWVTFK